MELYKNNEMFIDLITEISNQLKINEALIEKDYFVIYLLSELNKEIPGLLFKGGTSLSHAYNAINRFSEDIDLSLDLDHFGRSQNISANHKIVDVCKKLGFKIVNLDEVLNHSHGNFNRYYIEYPISFTSLSIKPFIQVEMTFFEKSFPSEIKSINSIIGNWLINNNYKDVASDYNLTSFNICVQNIERTFIDKIFAVCDYFMQNQPFRNSRHIYDLYMIEKQIDISSSSLKDLASKVKEERKKDVKCISAHDGFNVNNCLKDIFNTNFYQKDYNEVTSNLLTSPVSYSEAINILLKIIKEEII